jgi:glycosyltransferase involved in cell wall biosynthesis
MSDRFAITVLVPGSRGAARVESWSGFEVRRYDYFWPAAAQRIADGGILPNLRSNKWLLPQAPLLVLSQLWHAWRLVRHGKFDLVHAHWVLPQGLIGAALRRRLGVPLLTTAHGADVYALKTAVTTRAKRWAVQSSDHVTAVSRSLARQVVALGADPDRLSILSMGVDTRRFRPERASDALRRQLNPTGPVLLFVGRLVEKKGAAYAIDAMPAILDEVAHTRLIIVGDGPERPTLEARVRKLGLEDDVHFAGAISHDELPAYVASADLFVGPSVVEQNGDTDSFGLVFAEALASGCPVIATDVGGIEDVVIDGETGVVVPQRDAPAIADAAVRLLRNAAEREQLRATGLAYTREYLDQRLMAKRYGDLIERLAA